MFHEFYGLNAARISINSCDMSCSSIPPLQSRRNRVTGGFNLRPRLASNSIFCELKKIELEFKCSTVLFGSGF